MPPARKDKQHTNRKPPPAASRDSPKTRYSAPSSLMPKPSPSTLPPSLNSSTPHTLVRGASVATTSLPRNLSPATKPSNSSPASKPLPLPVAKSPSLATEPRAAARSPVPTTPRPEWIAPPGKYSPPTQIPTPKFVSSKRNRTCSPSPDTKSRNGSDGLMPSTPSAASSKMQKEDRETSETSRTLKTPSSPLFQEFIAEDTTNTPDHIVVTKPTSENPSIPRASENSGEERRDVGVGLSFEGPLVDTTHLVDLDFGVCLSTSPIATYANTNVAISGCSSLDISVMQGQGKRCDTKEKEKRDSFSPIHDSAIGGVDDESSGSNSRDKVDKPSHHFCPPSSLPLPLPSPSQTHPYVSGIHILPSCTSGSLTHRLVCGHLILTTRPEVCANNCVAQKTTFATAKLKAQGFVACVRNLDDAWKCPVCKGGRGEGR